MDTTVNVCSCSSSPWAGVDPSSSGRSAWSAASRTHVGAKAEFTSALTVTTAEGDKVTLSASALSEAEFSDYSLGYRQAGAKFAARAQAARQSRELSVQVSVEGDLSNRELADISKLMHNLQKASRRIGDGNFDAAQRSLFRTQNLDSIATFQYAAHVSEAVSFERQIVALSVPQTGGEGASV